MATRVIIDADGDVVLRLCKSSPSATNVLDEQPEGEKPEEEQSEEEQPEEEKQLKEESSDEQELVVSSKVLCLASPVFKKMFSEKFKEGADLARHKESSTLFTLDLFDDDAEAMIIFCRIIHVNNEDVPEKPTTHCLENLAFLCDKYACVGALKHCGALWLKTWCIDYDVISINELCQLLIFSYVMGRSIEFSELSWKLFIFHKGPFSSTRAQANILKDHLILPHNLLEILDRKRFTFCNKFHLEIMRFLNQNWSADTAETACNAIARKKVAYMDRLCEMKIFLYDLTFTQHRLCDLLKEMPDVTSAGDCSNARCRCRYLGMTTRLSDELNQEIQFMTDQQRNFNCLYCFKNNDTSHSFRSCQIDHAKPA